MSATSADKIRQAQAARRAAALKSASKRQARRKTSGTSPSPVATSPVVNQQASVSNSSNTASTPVVGMTRTVANTGGGSVSATSSDKVRQAQAARRAAAQKSAGQRQVRRKSSATSHVSMPAVSSQATATASSAVANDAPASEVQTAGLRERVESSSAVLAPDTQSVRQLCRARRRQMSSKGKVPSPKRQRASRAHGRSSAVGLVSREASMKHRREMSLKGRGNTPTSRPTGRRRPEVVPPKVEEGTTLSGGSVTGTQVERKSAVTGNEPGTCRAVTGTEYVGSEQFENFCQSKPEANQPKVGFSITNSGQSVSGTEVGRSSSVTGDETGSCKAVTGTEYMGSEHFKEFCNSSGTVTSAPKVMSSKTDGKAITVTGVDEARVNATTGTEAGAQKVITGSQYSDSGSAKLTINGPSKVALTHTIAGRSVTGTDVGRAATVTGDEYGRCHTISGTEYMSNEQFESVCQTSPVPHPAKVGKTTTNKGQRVTGNMMESSDKVTGNETGLSAKLTGSQYSSANGVNSYPKLNGDRQDGCLPVTGTGHYDQKQLSGNGINTQTSTPVKVGVEHTASGQSVSGTMLAHTNGVTGNEMGAEMPISGTPYAGIIVPDNHGSCCSACAAKELAEKAGLIAPQEQCDCAPSDNQLGSNTSNEASQSIQQSAAPQDFSISTPAKQAQQKQITGNDCGASERITGPNNMASQLISGTPEFRYQEPRVASKLHQPQAVDHRLQQHVVHQSLQQQVVHQSLQQPAVQQQPVEHQVVHAVHETPMQNQIDNQNQFIESSYQTAPVQNVQPVANVNQVQMSQTIHAQQVHAQQLAEQAAAAQVHAQQLAEQASLAQAQVQMNRITGEGRQTGFNISGDNWARGEQVTGTEGQWSQGRNLTLRGEPRIMDYGAYYNKDLERPEVPSAQVTGSSGNSSQGAVVTVSGGARG